MLLSWYQCDLVQPSESMAVMEGKERSQRFLGLVITPLVRLAWPLGWSLTFVGCLHILSTIGPFLLGFISWSYTYMPSRRYWVGELPNSIHEHQVLVRGGRSWRFGVVYLHLR
jgi:hypothetical protein